MGLIEMGLQRRRRSIGGSKSPSQINRPEVEVLEARECLSVTAPTSVQMVALSSTQVKVTWNDVANETGYRVFRWNGTQSVQVGIVGQNATTFTVTGLQPNQQQWFFVQAFDNTSTASTAWASIRTPGDAITAPLNLKVASATLSSITLTWADSTGETGYRIFSWDGSKATQVGTVAANTTAFTVQNLSPGLNYYFYVQAFNNTNSASTDWVSGATLTTQLTAPTNLSAQTLGPSAIGLAWTDASAETGYRVYRWDGNSATSPVVIATLGANTTGYQATGLVPGKTYWFYVQAFNATNSVANSAWASATTTPTAPLRAPTNVFVDFAGWSSVVVSWTEPARAVGYRVFVWTGFSWMPVATVASGTTSVQIDNLLTNRTQWFMVQAFTDNFAEVAFSNAVFINL